MVVKKFRHGSDLANYSRGLAIELHGDSVRDTGEFFWKHPMRVSGFAETGLKESELKPSALAAALLHDVREDIAEIQLYDPFDPPVIDIYSPNRLNDLLSDAGNRGLYACYMIYKLTRRNESYPDFMKRIISTSGDGVKRILDYIAIWLKICDRGDNSDPDEELDMDAFARNRPGWKGTREDAIKKFRRRQITNADDNIKYYLPMAESLIIELGALTSRRGKRVFSEEIAVNHGIFDYPAIRERFKQCYRQSAQILDRHEPCPYGSHLELAAYAGYNRDIVDTPGYTRVLTEILIENGFDDHPAASFSASRLR